MSEPSKVKLEQTFNRVISAIKVDQPLNKTNKLAHPCSLNVTEMSPTQALYVTLAVNGAILNAMECHRKNSNIMLILQMIRM